MTVAVGLPIPGRVRITPAGGETQGLAPVLRCRTDLEAMLAVRMAGGVAEVPVLGQLSHGAGLGPGSALDLATEAALAMESEYGLGNHDLPPAPVGHSMRYRLPERLRIAQARTEVILRTRRGLLAAVADALMARRELDAEWIATLVATMICMSVPAPEVPGKGSDGRVTGRVEDRKEAPAAPRKCQPRCR